LEIDTNEINFLADIHGMSLHVLANKRAMVCTRGHIKDIWRYLIADEDRTLVYSSLILMLDDN